MAFVSTLTIFIQKEKQKRKKRKDPRKKNRKTGKQCWKKTLGNTRKREWRGEKEEKGTGSAAPGLVLTSHID